MKYLFLAAPVLVVFLYGNLGLAMELRIESRFDVPIPFAARHVCLFSNGNMVAFNFRGGGVASRDGQVWSPIELDQGEWKAILCGERGEPAVAVTQYGVYRSIDGLRWIAVKRIEEEMIAKASVGKDGYFLLTKTNLIYRLGRDGVVVDVYPVPKKPEWDFEHPDIVFSSAKSGVVWYPSGDSVWLFVGDKFIERTPDLRASVKMLRFDDGEMLNEAGIVVLASVMDAKGRVWQALFEKRLDAWNHIDIEEWKKEILFVGKSDTEEVLVVGGDNGQVGLLSKKGGSALTQLEKLKVVLPKGLMVEGKRPDFYSAFLNENRMILSAAAECNACPSYIYLGSLINGGTD